MKFTILLFAVLAAAGAVQRSDMTPPTMAPTEDVIIEAEDTPSNLAARSALALAELEANPLEKRACVYNGCKCASGFKPGQYCGNCGWYPWRDNVNTDWMIRAKRVKSHIYQCARNGDCCSYGYADICTGKGKCG